MSILSKETYPYQPIYSNGKFSSYDFVAVCAKAYKLTINQDYFKPNHSSKKIDESIFHEIRMLSPAEKINPEYKQILEPMSPFKGSIKEFTARLKAALRKYIVTVWDSSKPHLFFHSSGYDSRILSGILMELRDEFGEEWIGDIHFRCHQPEGSGFLEIMKREKWIPSQYSVWKGPPTDHYDLGNPVVDVNGFADYVIGMNFWRDIIPFGDELNYVVITGIGGGEFSNYPVNRRPKKNIHWCKNQLFNQYLNFLSRGGFSIGHKKKIFDGVLTPFLSYSFLEEALKMPSRFLKKVLKSTDMVRHYILETFEPDLINISYIGHAYNFKFSAAREAEMWKHWRSSRFYRDYEHIPSVKNVNPLNRKNKFNACMYGFATVYEKIMNLREERSPHRARTGAMYPTSVIDLSRVVETEGVHSTIHSWPPPGV
jgi:hypothetical protein